MAATEPNTDREERQRVTKTKVAAYVPAKTPATLAWSIR